MSELRDGMSLDVNQNAMTIQTREYSNSHLLMMDRNETNDSIYNSEFKRKEDEPTGKIKIKMRHSSIDHSDKVYKEFVKTKRTALIETLVDKHNSVQLTKRYSQDDNDDKKQTAFFSGLQKK